MGKLKISDLMIYRWRYYIGYGVTIIVFISLLLFAGLYLPGGLSQAEMTSLAKSNSLDIKNFDPALLVNLPYLLLQKASIHLFGVTLLSVKLPSIIIGFIAGVGMLILLRRLFTFNVAVLASIVMVTTGQFIYLSQSGSAAILYILWSVWLLLSATMVAQRSRYRTVWKIVFFITASLSLYTPLSIYILLALGGAVALHPHLRFVVRKLSRIKSLVAILIGIVLASPVLFVVTKNPQVGLTLLGIPTSMPDFSDNAYRLVTQFLGFTIPTNGTSMTPLFGFGSMALIVFGLLQLVRDRHSTRSYVIIVWLVLLLPVLLLNPNFSNVTFVPFLLLIATGIQVLIGEWYKLFPRNPYARAAGLIPLFILITGLVVTGVDRYSSGYRYDPQSTANFNYDLQLLNKQLVQQNGDVTLVVSPDQRAFYKVVATNERNYSKGDVTVISTDYTIQQSHNTIIVTRDARTQLTTTEQPSTIATTDKATASDRFYIYKSTTK